jgi:hypothetical protein
MRDLFSNLAFYNAFIPGPSAVAAGATEGNTIDLRGYNAAAFAIALTSFCSGGANGGGDYFIFALQHGLPSDAGVSAWSLVPNSQLIHSVVGGYDSTAETGVFFSLYSASEITGSTQASIVLRVGYKGDITHRYLRLHYSNVGDASGCYVGAICILGLPADWPINSPV